MSSGNEDNTSTLQSIVDSAKGAAQSAIAAVTGNQADQTEADSYKDKAAAEHDASHATAKVGPFTATPSGAIAQDNSNRTQGSWDQTIGAGKEMIGNALGMEGLKQEGIKQNQAGKEAEAQGQLSDLGQGITDRVKGAAGSAYAGLTGDKDSQQKFQDQHDVGKTLQRGVEADLQKQADAQK